MTNAEVFRRFAQGRPADGRNVSSDGRHCFSYGSTAIGLRVPKPKGGAVFFVIRARFSVSTVKHVRALERELVKTGAVRRTVPQLPTRGGE